jgi:hypothetical protein
MMAGERFDSVSPSRQRSNNSSVDEDIMRIFSLTVFAVACVMSSGWRQAEAVPARPVDQDRALVHQVANVCGATGCVRVQTQKVRHHKPGNVGSNHI